MGREPEALGRGPMGAVHRLCLKVLSLCRSPATGPGRCPYPSGSPLSAGTRVLTHRVWRGLNESLCE